MESRGPGLSLKGTWVSCVMSQKPHPPRGAGARPEVREGELLGIGNRSLAHRDTSGSTGPSRVTRLSVSSQCGGAGKTTGGGDNHRGFLIDD